MKALVGILGHRLKVLNTGITECTLMHCSLFLKQGFTTSVYDCSFGGRPGLGMFLEVANKYLAPYIQPNHEPLLASTGNFSKGDRSFWMPAGKTEVVVLLLSQHLCLTGFLAALCWQEFLSTQKSVQMLCFYLHRRQIRSNCELVSVLRNQMGSVLKGSGLLSQHTLKPTW